MAHDVFVSHSARDKIAADAVVAHLERGGLRCWCAPRDIRPGADWPSSIVEGITGSRAMVVVLSSSANESGHIPREVERAVNRGLPVIPVRIEDVLPQGGLEYFFSSSHWMDAITPPLEQHLDRLAEQLRVMLKMKEESSVAESRKTSPAPTALPSQFRLAPIVGAIVILAAVVVGALWFYGSRKPGNVQTPVAIPAPPATNTASASSPDESPTAVPIAPAITEGPSRSLGESPLAAEYQQWKKLSMITWNNSYLIDHARQRYSDWRRAADAGDAIGQFFVGYAYQHGLTVPEDPEEAVVWLTKSAEQKNSDAMLDLALCYGMGIGTQQNVPQYGSWIKEALDSGNTSAMVVHGMGLIVLSPLASDKEEGKRLVYQAADAGNLDGMFSSGLINANSPAEFNSRLKKAALGGQPDALYIRAEGFKGTEQGRKMVAQALKTMGDPLAVARIIDPKQKFGFNHPNLYPDLAWKRLSEMADEGSTEASRLAGTLRKNGKTQ